MSKVFRHSILSLVFVLLVAAPAFANHSWGNYHWARTSNPFTLKVGDNVHSAWDAYLDEALSDWNQSTVLNNLEVVGQANPKNCRPSSGRIEVCASKYGNNGWLGIAQIWASGSHITQAVAKMNDTYFNSATYNTPAWRRMVMCQEVAHDYGLDHQDETFDNANLGSCMDYTNDPDGGAGGASQNDPSNEHPNSHDFQQLSTIYQHLDSTTTIQWLDEWATAYLMPPVLDGDELNGPGEWGRLVRTTNEGRTSLFVRQINPEERVLTFVIWATEEDDSIPDRGGIERN